MKNKLIIMWSFVAVIGIACQEKKPANTNSEAVASALEKPDLAAIKAEIQSMNDAWAAASNKKDAATILNFYADDAVSMPSNMPISKGREAIQKQIVAEFAKRNNNQIMSFTTTEVFGDENIITETGITIVKDAAGKVVSSGKYMSLWEKRDGKWLVIRDIYNEDQ